MECVGRDHQVVFVDDESTDLTYTLLKELAVIDPHVTVVRLRRNFGQTGALAAGIAHSTGEVVIAMDGDLQHDPAEIPAFLEKTRGGLGHRKRLAEPPHRQSLASEDSHKSRKRNLQEGPAS